MDEWKLLQSHRQHDDMKAVKVTDNSRYLLLSLVTERFTSTAIIMKLLELVGNVFTIMP